jgi:signal transduction histidine kinase
LHYANRGFLRTDFLREISKLILDFSGCDTVELHLLERGKNYRCITTLHPEPSFSIESNPTILSESGEIIPASQNDSDLKQLRKEILNGHSDSSSPFFTENGSFWAGDTNKPISLRVNTREPARPYNLSSAGGYRSLAIFPLVINGGKNERIGLLEFKSAQPNCFTPDEIEFYEGVAGILGVALAHRRAQVALRERVKELTCLYGIAQIVERPDISLDEMLQGIVELLPPAWLYPESALARIIVDGRSYTTPEFHEGRHRQTADIIVTGQGRGVVEVVYSEEKPELDEGPFLKEERSLIDTIARELALLIERRQAEEEKLKFQEQLRHADRLATIGQLAAGVAHELNEPLSNILGFAQLANKCPGLPKQAEQDIDKIVKASLHAREVVKKLLIFARQMPPSKTLVNLNQIVKDGLYLLDPRFAKKGIDLALMLAPDLPEITADPAQLHQVLVNLIVNAVQAMPEGGRLTIRTLAHDDHLLLIVEDTGVGMSEEVLKQIFVPFFTTKDIGQGTGLGLSVVHGIVTAHGGSIKVESEPDKGSRFEVRLPVAEGGANRG